MPMRGANGGSAILRLLAIESRRTVATWLAPPLAVIAWLSVSGTVRNSVFYWPEASATIARTAVLAGPFMAGVAAWMAGRQARSRLGDLLETTPRPDFARDLVAWLATTTWGLLAYAALGGYLAARAWRAAEWGGPDPWLIGAGALATVAYAAVGYALGRALPYRLTAPLLAVGTFLAQYLLAYADRLGALPGRARFLSPAANWWSSVWFGALPRILPAQVLFFAGLTGLSLALLAWGLRRWRSLPAALATLLSFTLTVGGAGYAMVRTPANLTPLVETAPLLSYEPVCSADPFPVCVHPSARERLPELSRQANAILAPLVGLRGFPPRAEQTGYDWRTREGTWPTDVIPFQETTPTKSLVLDTTLFNLIENAVAPPPTSGVRNRRLEGAQVAITRWLWRQAGLTPINLFGPCDRPPYAATCAATERFARLDPATQRAWLATNLVPLREGRLRLEDLP
jgi:hypothetical protein